jgi:hypothetical protein
MAPSVADIARLRRMTNEPTTTPYTDDLLSTYLSAWPLVDKNGLTIDNGGTSWIEAYDLHAAAADIWEEKASVRSDKHDFTADGANYSASQMYEYAIEQAKHHRAEQKAQVKRQPVLKTTGNYYGTYANPIFDEDEDRDWMDGLENII